MTTNSEGSKAIKRSSAVTSEAILRSAVQAFARKGYSAVGLREVAGDAGVTAVLVNRYFGTKELLFAAAVDVAFADDGLFRGDPRTLAKRLGTALVAKTEPGREPVDPLLLLLRSAADPGAAEILRDKIALKFQKPIEGVLVGPQAKKRAALLLAQIAGFQLMRTVLGVRELVDARGSSLADLLETMFKSVIDQPTGSA